MAEKARRSIFSDIFHFLTSNVFAACIGFASSIILTRLLGPHNKGILTTALVIPNIIIGFSILGMRQSTVVNVGGKKYSDHEMIHSLFYLFLITSIIGIILCSIFFASDSLFTKELSIYAIAFILILIPAKVGNNYLNSFYLGKSHFRIINRIKWMNAVFYLLFIFFIVYFLNYGVSGVLLSLDLTAIISSVILISLLFYYQYYHFSKISFNKAIVLRLVSLGVVYALALVIIQLNLRADVLLLKYFKGNEIVGYYSIAVAIAESLWQFPIAIGTVMISRTANSEDLSKTIKDTNLVVRTTIIIAIILGILIFCLSPYLIPIIYGNSFAPSIPIVQTIIPGIIFFAIMRILVSFIAGTGKPWTIIKIGIPALIINIAINIFIIPLWGGIGAAIATNISYFFVMIFTIIYYIRKYNINISDLVLLKKDDITLFRKYLKSIF